MDKENLKEILEIEYLKSLTYEEINEKFNELNKVIDALENEIDVLKDIKVQDVLRILKNGAEKPVDDLNEFCKGKSIGQIEAYAHALELVRNLFN